MKRIFAAFGMCAVLITAGGCAAAQTAGHVTNRMAGSFTADVTMTTADSETKGTLTRWGTDAWSVAFTEPPALSGVQLEFVDNEVKASYKGLEFSVPQSAQAVRTMLSELMEIVDEMSQQTELNGKAEENSIICEGEIDEGDYTLTFSQEGAPVEFSLPCYGLTILFENFSESGTPAGTQETAATTMPTETAVTQTT